MCSAVNTIKVYMLYYSYNGSKEMTSWKHNNLPREFSMPKSIALAKHYNDAEELILHLFKLYFYSNSRTFNHWTNEIADKSDYTYRLKTKNKYLTKEEILNCWIGPIETDEEFDIFYRLKMSKLSKDYEDIKSLTKEDLTANKEKVKSFIYEYLTWASDELSKRGFIELEEVKDKLQELFKIHGGS